MNIQPLDAEFISTLLPKQTLVGREIRCLEQVDSTNTLLKQLAAQGAPEGLTLFAEEQTAGRGRRNRQYLSLRGAGLYLSVLLRPRCAPMKAVDLTAWVAVAVCDGSESACGLRPQIKWINDIMSNGKKLCGILTEMNTSSEGRLDYVVVGIGINLSHTKEDFARAGLDTIATSLALEGVQVNRAHLAACILEALDRMYRRFPAGKQDYLDRYRRDCLTTGRSITLLRPHGSEDAFAQSIDEGFCLVIRHADGRLETVSSGEVSVRGIGGYI